MVISWLLLFVAAAPASGPVVDFVAASVNDTAISESEVRKAMIVSALRPEAGESAHAYRTRVLLAMIDERLQHDDAVRFGTSPPDAADVEDALKKLKARLTAEGKDPAAEFSAAGMTPEDVRASVEVQLVIQRYLVDRVRPIAAAEDRTKEEYEKYYVPERQAAHQTVEPLESVGETMRRRSEQRIFYEEVEKWAKELREKARIAIYKVPGSGPEGRTPVVLSTAKPTRSPTPTPTPR